MLDATTQERVNSWLSGAYDEETKAEIRQLLAEGKTEELTDAFYRDLEFGTGGLRGIMGVGTNRMNRYTLGKATQGLANYILKSFPEETQLKVAIAHDSRNNSPAFARLVGDVFSANGITVYHFESLRPTPLLSYAIRKLGCQSGVVITASHNPKEYNGYKAYWNDGAQVITPHDTNIIAEVNRITDIAQVKFEGDEYNKVHIGKEVEEHYLNAISQQVLHHHAIERQADLKIVYTPLHGTGITMVPDALRQLGFTNVHIVQEQATPDGNFPTVVYPNPEEKEAMTLALREAEKLDADLVMATDPDADRVGIAIKNSEGEFILLNGNQTGCLLMYYLLRSRKEKGLKEQQPYIVKTIVTTDLMDRIAERYGVDCYNTLTGFKYIAAIIREKEGQATFIAGAEESYGYMVGDFVRDKDAVASCAMIAEIAAYARDKGQTLFDLLLEMYQEFGLYREDLVSITKKGKRGAEEITAMMQNFRQQPPQQLGGSKVTEIIDYQQQVHRHLSDGTEKPVEMPKSNVLQFITEDGTKISARPSGTEPKIKFYVSVTAPLPSATAFSQVSAQLEEKTRAVMTELQQF